jgi:hypothetical protein
MDVVDNSCFWLAEFLKKSSLKVQFSPNDFKASNWGLHVGEPLCLSVYDLLSSVMVSIQAKSVVDHEYVTSLLLNRQIDFYDNLAPKKDCLSLITLILMFILFQV